MAVLRFVKNEDGDTHYNVYRQVGYGWEGIGIVEKIGTKNWRASNAQVSKSGFATRALAGAWLSSPADVLLPGQRVEVTASDPEWPFAVSGYPVLGTVGVVSQMHSAPEGRTAVLFPRGFRAIREDGTDDWYLGCPYTLHIPTNCLRRIEEEK